MSWISPTGHDFSPDWTDEEKAYDDNEITHSDCFMDYGTGWYGYLTLTHAAITSTKIRFKIVIYDLGMEKGLPGRKVDVDVYKDGAWVDVDEITDFAEEVWIERSFAEGSVTKMRLRFYCPIELSAYARVYEADFWEEEEEPPDGEEEPGGEEEAPPGTVSTGEIKNPNCCLPYNLPFNLGLYPGDKRVILRRILNLDLALTKDDGATAARILTCFEMPESKRRDLLKRYDVIVTVGRSDERDDLLGDEQLTIGAYNLEIWCVDRQGVSGWKLRKKATQAIKEIIEANALGSFRKQVTTRDEDQAGSPKLYHTIHTVEYYTFNR